MELNTRGRYAVMAMADLARQAGGQAVPLSQISERQRITIAYLEQLFQQLRRCGLVESARGRAGGYRLARSARDISVAEVMAAVEEGTRMTRCAGHDGEACMAGARCLTHDLWEALGDEIAAFLRRVSLQDVIDGLPGRAGPIETLAVEKLAAEKLTAETSGGRDAGGGRRASLDRRSDRDRSMSRARTYFDWNATAPLRREARDAMIAALDCVGNASSVHAEGRRARGIVETAREKIAALVGATPGEVVLTSGGTEANNCALRAGWRHVVHSAIEHASVLAPIAASGAAVTRLAVDGDGVVDLEGISRALAAVEAKEATILSVQMANNETGVLQPVAEAAAMARRAGVAMHTDAVQAAGRMAIDFGALGVDMISLSAHKLGGPKGAGALIVRDGCDLPVLLAGGGQERGRRAGTENIAAIAGFGAAAEAALGELALMADLEARRQQLEAAIRQSLPGSIIVGGKRDRLANTICFSCPGLRAETVVIRLDLGGVAISAGSACSSGKVGASHVLAAMGMSDEVAQSAVRVSFGLQTTDDDFDRLLAALAELAGVGSRGPIRVDDLAAGAGQRLETMLGDA